MSSSIDCVEVLIEEMNNMVERPGLNPAIPVEAMDWDAFHKIVSDGTYRVVNLLRRYCRMMEPKSLRHQVYMTTKMIEETGLLKDNHIWVTIACLFRKTGDQTRQLYTSFKKYRQSPGKTGRPRLLDDEQISQVIERVRLGVQMKHPLTKRDLLLFINNTWQIEASKRWVSRLLKNCEELVLTRACPLERPRAEVSQAELTAFYNKLSECLENVKPEFVFNMDEVGFSRQARGTPFMCIAPKECAGKDVEALQTSDGDSTFTMVATVALDGSSIPPLVVCPCKTLPREFLEQNLWLGRDGYLEYSASGFSNSQLTSLWYDNVFLPCLQQRRQNVGNRQEPAVLLLDGFRAHDTDVFRAKAARDNVRVIYLPPHSSHKTQPLDQYVFASMKWYYARLDESRGHLDRNCRKILKMVKAFQYGACTFNVRASWMRVGIHARWTLTGECLGIRVDGATVVTNHVDLHDEFGTRKRVPVGHVKSNDEELAQVANRRCPCCGRPFPQGEQEPARRVRRIRLFMG